MPKKYLDIMKEFDVTKKDFIFFSEHNLRNRFSRRCTKWQEQGVVLANKKSKIFNLKGSEIPLGKVMEKDSHTFCIPFCRSIIAQKMADSKEKEFDVVVNFFDGRMYLCSGSFAVFYYKIFGKKETLNKIINCYFYPYKAVITQKTKIGIQKQVINKDDITVDNEVKTENEFLNFIKK